MEAMRQKFPFLTVAALTLVVMLGAQACATTGAGTGMSTRESSDIKDQLFKLQKDSARMLKKIEDLERGDEGGSHAACAEAAARVQNVESQVIVLEEQILATQHRMDEALGELRTLRSLQGGAVWTTEPVNEEQQWPSAENERPPSRSPAPRLEGAPEDLFNSAYADYSRGNYELALAGFEATHRSDPSGPLADDAQYWVGESLYALGRYVQSAEAFERVIQAYPGGDKLRASHLKKGLALFEARRANEGVTTLRYVIESWPSSDEARIAREYFRRKGIAR